MKNSIRKTKSLHFANFVFIALTLALIVPTAAHAAGGVEESTINKYKTRYELGHALQKRVDNRGNGDEALYGVRNFRMVLPGVLYRGGANNLYHQTKPRANENPLPEDGLMNLCKQGFRTAIYLYTTNYNTASKTTSCETTRGAANQLTYLQLNPFNDMEEILKLVHKEVLVEYAGPIYSHCWNGWHASGLVAATALRQFCGLSASEAVRYWNLATDGVNGPEYEKVRTRITEFTPIADLEFPSEIQLKVCPSIEQMGLLTKGEKIKAPGPASKMMEVKL
jgi:hypothetical protein